MKKNLINILERTYFKIFGSNEKSLISIYAKYKEYTMIPQYLYLDNLELCQRYFTGEGAIVECGVWRGGMIAGLAEFMKDRNNIYYLYDSFEGLPKVKDIDGEKAKMWQEDKSSPIYYDNCKAEQEFSENLLKKLNVKYKIISGWFNEVLPLNKPSEEISILRLDADWYDSTIVCLENLYPLVKQKGLIIIDDYFAWDGCSKAVHEYLNRIKSTSKIHETRFGTAYIIKNETL